MISKQETTLSFETMLGEAFTGTLTLKDEEAQDLKERLDTIPGLIKTEKHNPGGQVQYMYSFSTSEDLIQRQSGPRLPGKRQARFERCVDGNCEWLVQSELQGSDWIEKRRRCIGYRGVEPPCPLNMTVEVRG